MPARSLQEVRADLDIAHQEYGDLEAMIRTGSLIPTAVVQHAQELAERLKALESEVSELETGTR
jgi:hypothetical protein